LLIATEIEKTPVKRTRVSVAALSGVSVILTAFMLLFIWMFPYTGDGDSVLHYHNARDTARNIAAGLSAWSRPAYTLPLALLAPYGMPVARLLTVAITLATFWQTVRLAEDLRLRNAMAAGFMVLFQASAFALLTDTMTEMPMALGVVIAVRLWIHKWFVSSALVVGFLPMVRPEGYFLGVLFGLYALFAPVKWTRKSIILAAMSLGLIVWAVASKIWVHDWLGFLPNNSWPMHAAAPKGPIWWYAARWPECVGLPLFVLFVPGVLKFFRERSSAWWLIGACWFMVFAVHSILFWRGIFASWGLIRILASVAPMTAVICLRGWVVISDWFTKRPRLAWLGGRAALATVLTAAALWAFAYYVMIDEHLDCFPIVRTAHYIQEQKLLKPGIRLLCGNQMLQAELDTPPDEKTAADLPLDRADCWKKFRDLPLGSYLVWDNKQSPVWYKFRTADLVERGFTVVHEEKFMTPYAWVFGFEPSTYVVLRKDSQQPEEPPPPTQEKGMLLQIMDEIVK
jgi:hypothetical protein